MVAHVSAPMATFLGDDPDGRRSGLQYLRAINETREKNAQKNKPPNRGSI